MILSTIIAYARDLETKADADKKSPQNWTPEKFGMAQNWVQRMVEKIWGSRGGFQYTNRIYHQRRRQIYISRRWWLYKVKWF